MRLVLKTTGKNWTKNWTKIWVWVSLFILTRLFEHLRAMRLTSTTSFAVKIVYNYNLLFIPPVTNGNHCRDLKNGPNTIYTIYNVFHITWKSKPPKSFANWFSIRRVPQWTDTARAGNSVDRTLQTSLRSCVEYISSNSKCSTEQRYLCHSFHVLCDGLRLHTNEITEYLQQLHHYSQTSRMKSEWNPGT